MKLINVYFWKSKIIYFRLQKSQFDVMLRHQTHSLSSENQDLLPWQLLKKIGENRSWSSRTFCHTWLCILTNMGTTADEYLFWHVCLHRYKYYSDHHMIFWWPSSTRHQNITNITSIWYTYFHLHFLKIFL
jgi:hypothetical protein